MSNKNSVFQETLEDQQYKDNITSSSIFSSDYDNFYALGQDKFGGNGWRGHMPLSSYDLSSPSSTLHLYSKTTGEHQALISASSVHNSEHPAYEVFDGSKPYSYTERDIPGAINPYGESKLAAERYTVDILERYCCKTWRYRI